MTEQDLHQWLVLYFQDTLPPRLIDGLLRQFESPEQILCASRSELRASGLKTAQIDDLHNCVDKPALQQNVDQALAWAKHAEQHIIVRTDRLYPPLLKEIHDPPLLLYVLGQPEALLRPQIAIVGSRRCSVDGKRNTHHFAQSLAKQGFSICSGLARGIDGAAHEGALDAGGVTVAVMGTGADQIYPSQHRNLASTIKARGALASELPLGSGPTASHFPKRNRIISGMSLGVIVVEAALKSGSLISARLAIEHNRELFAIPSSIRNALSRGPHQLIQQGAHLVDAPEQIVEHLHSLLGSQLALLPNCNQQHQAQSEDNQNAGSLPADQLLLLEAMGFDPVSLETLVERMALPLSTVQSALLNLELQGLIRLEAGHYVLS